MNSRGMQLGAKCCNCSRLRIAQSPNDYIATASWTRWRNYFSNSVHVVWGALLLHIMLILIVLN